MPLQDLLWPQRKLVKHFNPERGASLPGIKVQVTSLSPKIDRNMTLHVLPHCISQALTFLQPCIIALGYDIHHANLLQQGLEVEAGLLI